MSVQLDTLLETVGGLYEGAADPALVASVGARLARLVGAESALVFVARKADARLERMISVTANFDSRARDTYDAHFHRTNVWFQRGSRLPTPVSVLGGQLIDYTDFERTEFWNDWARTVGIYHTLGSTAPMGHGLVTAVGIHRGRSSAAFGEEERALMRQVVPHLARSLQLGECLSGTMRAGQAEAAALNRLGVGLVLVGADNRVLFANAIAERLIGRLRWISVRDGRLRAVHPASGPALDRALAAVRATVAGEGMSSGGVVRLRDPLARDLPVLVSPFRLPVDDLSHHPPHAVVMFSDPDAQLSVSTKAIAVAFDLTRAEAALVAALVSGETIAAFAQRTGISFHTARAQLRAIFDKTGFTRQPELIAAVLNALVLRVAT